MLQLHDLEGDIVATAAKSETETKLLTTYNSTEFGVQVNGTPPTKYSWLGASGLATEAASAAIASAGSSYVPQLGRELQTQAVAPPGSPNGSYISPYISSISAGTNEVTAAFAAEAPTREAARQKAAQELWERDHPPVPPVGAVPSPGEGGAGEPPNYCLLAIITEQEDEGCGDGGGGGYECSGDNACAAAPCANGDNPHSNHCGAQLPGRELCSNPLQQGCRVSTGRLPSGTRLGNLKIINSPEGPLVGCIIGGVAGGTFAAYSTVGLATAAGATGGCFVGGGFVIIVEHIF